MAYFYLYDNFLQERAYATQLIRLENTLTDLGLQGRVGRLSLLKSIRDLINSAVREGADTLVAVGDDTTLSRLIEVASTLKQVTIGFIPLGTKNQNLAKLLGIPLGLLACQILSNRLIQAINLGKINGQFFWQKIEAEGIFNCTCEQNAKIILKETHHLSIYNFGQFNLENRTFTAEPQDNLFEVILQPIQPKTWWHKKTESSYTLLQVRNLKLTALPDDLVLTVDNFKNLKTPATVIVASEKIRLIVGKDRVF